ncbi:MAG: glycoside hydrolase family 140 protein [Anaerolineae bacterium]|nr:glycoside hydrolase family 140 protein [Anaerolineae bacterium]
MSYPLEPLRVSEDGRYLVTESGRPFFWLGDTAWELFHRCTLEEAELYLENRRRKGFTVIQAVALAEFDGLHTPNPYGDLPLHDDDPTRPNEAYFRHVDAVIRLAADKGLYVGLLPTWGDKVVGMWGAGPMIFDAENAYTYGRWLAARYRRQPNIIWILGGDRPAIHGELDLRPIWRAMAAGIDEGAGGRPLKTYHPQGGYSSSAWLHAEPWLDFNMMQSGHGHGPDAPTWEMVEHDYGLEPPKPVLDGEPNYEDHPVRPWPRWDPADGYYRDHDVRKQIYRSVFAGACGVTYGHHSIWQFYDPRKRAVVNHADRSWQAALERPGARHAGYLRRLMASRPALARIPDQTMLCHVPRGRHEHTRATRDREGRYALIYTPIYQPITVRLNALAATQVRAWWFNPRTAVATEIGILPGRGEHTFDPPVDGPDWVVVLDDAAQEFPAPGTISA